jgi:hypothetical protein
VLTCVSEWLPANRKVKLCFGWPSCTHTAVSGAKHFKAKGPKAAAEAFTLIARIDSLCKWFDCPYAWEQPVSTTATYAGEPQARFDPCDYAGYAADPGQDAYTKKTCVWHGNGFVMPAPKRVEPVRVCRQGSWVQMLGGKSERTKNLRSATPRGFARAVFEANSRSGAIA